MTRLFYLLEACVFPPVDGVGLRGFKNPIQRHGAFMAGTKTLPQGPAGIMIRSEYQKSTNLHRGFIFNKKLNLAKIVLLLSLANHR